MRSLAYEGLVVGKTNIGHYRGWTVSKRTLSRVDCISSKNTESIMFTHTWCQRNAHAVQNLN